MEHVTGFRTDCYWFRPFRDASATVNQCGLETEWGECPCSSDCEMYVNRKRVDEVVRKRLEEGKEV